MSSLNVIAYGEGVMYPPNLSTNISDDLSHNNKSFDETPPVSAEYSNRSPDGAIAKSGNDIVDGTPHCASLHAAARSR